MVQVFLEELNATRAHILEVLTAVTEMVICVINLCSSDAPQCFADTYHLASACSVLLFVSSVVYLYTLKMEVIFSTETLVFLPNYTAVSENHTLIHEAAVISAVRPLRE